MSLFYAPGIPDEALANEMTVFLNPLRTEPCYQPGVGGVRASLLQLEFAVFCTDWQSTCSALGDMAMCMNIACREVPNGDLFDFGDLQSMFSELEQAVDNNEITEVRFLLREMLKAADLLDRTKRHALSA